MENEAWKKTYLNENYSVSNLGRVRHDTKNLILKPFKIGTKNHQYLAVDVGKKKSVKVHRLVAIAFLGESDKPQVNHIDGNHFNNCVDNLEWVTGSENCIHAYRVLGREKTTGAKNYNARKVVRIEDGKLYYCLKDAAKDNNLKSHASILTSIKRPHRKAAGYHWKYLEA